MWSFYAVQSPRILQTDTRYRTDYYRSPVLPGSEVQQSAATLTRHYEKAYGRSVNAVGEGPGDTNSEPNAVHCCTCLIARTAWNSDCPIRAELRWALRGTTCWWYLSTCTAPYIALLDPTRRFHVYPDTVICNDLLGLPSEFSISFS